MARATHRPGADARLNKERRYRSIPMKSIFRAEALLRHRQLEVEGLSIHVVEGGQGKQSSVLFLRDWPENWESFESLMLLPQR